MPAIVCKDVCKFYPPSIRAVDSLSWEIEEHSICGLIGPDGAGKSTLIRMMATLTDPSKGSIKIFGHDVAQSYLPLRKIIGYVPSRFSLYPDLSVRENIRFFASIYQQDFPERLRRLSDIYSLLAPFEKRKAGQLSGGMKQKLSLCCALIHTPKLLLLDEPTTGVDPVSRKEFWQILKRLVQEEDITIVVSTPYMDEAEKCHTIALMNQGKLLEIATPQKIKELHTETLWKIVTERPAQLLRILREDEAVDRAFSFGDSIHSTLTSPHLIDSVRKRVSEKVGAEIIFTATEPSIEDYFLKLQNRP